MFFVWGSQKDCFLFDSLINQFNDQLLKKSTLDGFLVVCINSAIDDLTKNAFQMAEALDHSWLLDESISKVIQVTLTCRPCAQADVKLWLVIVQPKGTFEAAQNVFSKERMKNYSKLSSARFISHLMRKYLVESVINQTTQAGFEGSYILMQVLFCQIDAILSMKQKTFLTRVCKILRLLYCKLVYLQVRHIYILLKLITFTSISLITKFH